MTDPIKTALGLSEEELQHTYNSLEFQSLYKALESSNPRFKELPSNQKMLALALVMRGKCESVPNLWRLLYRREVPPIEDFLQAEFIGEDLATHIFPAWRSDMYRIFQPESAIDEWILCLQGDTIIPTLDGNKTPIKDLVEKPPFNVYSYDETRKIIAGRAWGVRQTGVDEIYRVWLDDGSYVETNADHQLVTLNNRKIKVKDLKPGTSLAPLHFDKNNKVISHLEKDRKLIKVEKTGRVEPVYCMTVDKYHNFGIMSKKEDGTVNVNGIISSNTGAIGIGKSSAAMLAHFYNLYRVTSLRQPQNTMGTQATKPMNLQLMTVTKIKAESTMLEGVRTLLEVCPGFQEVRSKKDFLDFQSEEYEHIVPYCEDQKHGAMRICFPNKVNIAAGSQNFHALGEDLFGCALDEAEFREGKSVEAVFDLYTNIVRRVDSRFPGIRYTLSTLMSSVQQETGVMSTYVRAIRKNNPKKKVSSYAIWEVKSPTAIKEFGHFWVMRGTNTHPSKILTEEEYKLAEEEKFLTPPGCKLIKVPNTERDKFEFRIEKSLMDLAGEYTSGFDRPFDDLSNLEHVDAAGEISFVAPLQGGIPLIDQLPQEVFVKTPEGMRLRRYPNAKRYMHCDLADTGEAGISLVHKEMSVDGQIKYVFDFIGKVVSPNRISFQMVDDFIIDLRDRAEVTIAVLSADQYQSVSFLQKMETRRIAKKVKKLSVDMTSEAYNTAANAVSEGAVVTGKCSILKKQLGSVYIEKNKPWADNDDRKDMADSFVGSLYNAITNPIDVPANVYEHYQYISEIQDGDVPEGFKEL